MRYQAMGRNALETPIWQTEGAAKRRAVQAMFDDIAPSYDRVNAIISFFLHGRWRRIAVQKLNLRPGQHALDVCCGTGDFMIPLRRAVTESGFVTGVDFSLPMLSEVHRKPNVGPVSLGDACALPMQSGQFDGVSVGWGIRNVPDIDQAHRELVRVLRPGGRFVSLDMARPKNPVLRRLSEFVMMNLVPRIGALVGKTAAYTYLPKSTQVFWTREQLAASMESAGLVDVGSRDLFFGNICIHWGQKP